MIIILLHILLDFAERLYFILFYFILLLDLLSSAIKEFICLLKYHYSPSFVSIVRLCERHVSSWFKAVRYPYRSAHRRSVNEEAVATGQALRRILRLI